MGRWRAGGGRVRSGGVECCGVWSGVNGGCGAGGRASVSGGAREVGPFSHARDTARSGCPVLRVAYRSVRVDVAGLAFH